MPSTIGYAALSVQNRRIKGCEINYLRTAISLATSFGRLDHNCIATQALKSSLYVYSTSKSGVALAEVVSTIRKIIDEQRNLNLQDRLLINQAIDRQLGDAIPLSKEGGR